MEIPINLFDVTGQNIGTLFFYTIFLYVCVFMYSRIHIYLHIYEREDRIKGNLNLNKKIHIYYLLFTCKLISLCTNNTWIYEEKR